MYLQQKIFVKWLVVTTSESFCLWPQGRLIYVSVHVQSVQLISSGDVVRWAVCRFYKVLLNYVCLFLHVCFGKRSVFLCHSC